MSAPPAALTIRKALPDEGHDIAAVWLRSRAASVPRIPPPVHTPDEVRGWFADVVLPTREVWVAEHDAGPVALLVLDGDWLDQLYVDPAHTGAGIGGALVAHGKRLRPEGLQLWTFQSNTGARRFYERHEFVAVGQTDGDNEEGAPDVRYEWRGPTVQP